MIEGLRDSAASLALVLRASWRTGPRSCVIALAETVAAVLVSLLPLLYGSIVDAVVGRDQYRASMLLAGVILLLAVTSWMAIIGAHHRLMLLEQVGHVFDQEIAALSAEIPTIEHFEDPDFLDRVQILRDQQGALGMAFNMLLNALRNLAQPAVLVATVTVADPRMAILVLAAVLTLGAERWTLRWQSAAEDASAEEGRRTEHLMEAGLSLTPNAELRVFGSRRLFVDRLRRAVRAWRDPFSHAARKVAALKVAVTIGYFVVAAAVLVWLAYDVAQGSVSVGRFAVVLTATAGLTGKMSGAAWAIGAIGESLRAVGRYRWLQGYHRDQLWRTEGGLAAPEVLVSGIRLENLSFTYRDSSRPALDGVNLDVPAGAVVAVVGENGAGKTALVKLLTGMYQPDEGRILIDGVSLAEVDRVSWYQRCAAVFQDHVRFQETIRTGVTLGDLSDLDDEERARDALRRAAAGDLESHVPGGLDTPLGTLREGGVELSGGQWQRVAVARAMMRRQPLLLVLDEPTSALDPASEAALFAEYVSSAHRIGRSGGITLLVTHRFSTVTAADLVVVMDEGRISEVGSHVELLERDSNYARLFRLQAQAYA